MAALTGTGAIDGTKLGTKFGKPRWPGKGVISALGRVGLRVVEGLSHPGAMLVTPILTGGERTFADDLANDVAELERAMVLDELESRNR